MKKGFISMTIVYSFLLVFIFTLLAFLLLYTQKSRLLDSIVNESKEELYNYDGNGGGSSGNNGESGNGGNNSGNDVGWDDLASAPTIVEDVSQMLNKKVRYVRTCTAGSSVDLQNRWVEIEVYVGDNNVAKGKIPWNSRNTDKTLYNPGHITDGNADTYGYIESNVDYIYNSIECISVDLGQEYTVDKITVKHYYLDNRVYYFDETYVYSNNTGLGAAIYMQKPETAGGKTVEVNVDYNDGYYAFGGTLRLWYDGIINTGSNARSTDTNSWKNLGYSSVSTSSATITGGTWGDDYLQLNGSNSWINTGLIDEDGGSKTLEATFSVPSLPSEEATIIGNFQNGGYGIKLQSDGKIVGSYYSNSQNKYVDIISDTAIEPNKKYTVAYTYGCQAKINDDGDTSTCIKWSASLYINGVLQSDEIALNQSSYYNEIKSQTNNTVLAVGCDPNGTSCDGGYFSGKIYSIRYYQTRALLPESIYYNHVFDRNRFNS